VYFREEMQNIGSGDQVDGSKRVTQKLKANICRRSCTYSDSKWRHSESNY